MLSALLLFMILLAAAQIFSRNVYDAGLPWGDILVRILVLWVGLFGAMAASAKGDHIKIDLISKRLSSRWSLAANAATDLFTAVVCAFVVWFGAKFVYYEYADGLVAFAEVPVWICEAIIPFSFFVISVRYFARAVSDILGVVKKLP